MKITNTYNLPEPFVNMARSDAYTCAPNEYRVTSLLKGIRETILERRHQEEIEVDVSDMVWMLFGTAVHGILEQQQEKDNELKEERLKVPIDGYVLSGQFDLYNDDEKQITDYKTASVWKIIYGNYEDWRRQLLIYAYMLRQTGFDANKGRIVAFLKDHSKRDAKTKKGYPALPVYPVNFAFKESDFAAIEAWLKDRLAQIKEAEQLPDDELPICTPEERFNSGDKYAVMKRGRKTALRVLDSELDARTWIREQKKGDYIDVRPGIDKKCEDYCSVNKFCSYWKEKANGK